jgi:two-component system sensor histidine kinase KdpD
MRTRAADYSLAIGGVALVAWATCAFLPMLGLASSALLFLLPVLLASARGGLGPGMVAALCGAGAYNFFLLPPRFSLRIHATENLVSVVVLAVVALVTSRLANNLRAREAEASARAAASEEVAQLSALLAKGAAAKALEKGLGYIAARYGALVLLQPDAPMDDASFCSLDQSAAAWARHNGDMTGHSTLVMAAAEWSFIPLLPKARQDGPVLALARPTTGATREALQMVHVQTLCRLLGQAWDRVALEEERVRRERLAQADSLRRTLLASLAHDFRTPMTVVTGHLEGLAQDHPPAREALMAARRLGRTMEDLLAMARIEDGSLSPRLESLDLVDVVAQACHGRDVSRAIGADLPFARADAVLLHHILTNLLDNAGRHARTIVALSATTSPGALHLAIEDDGPGVPPAERARVFHRFARIEGGDRHQGSGLGLAIVQGFADAMGMTITIDDSPLAGARFTLSMPQAGA